MLVGLLLLSADALVSCKPEQSSHLTVTELRERYEEYQGKCVTVTGFTDGLALFATNRDRTRVREVLAQRGSVADFSEQVGVYFPEKMYDQDLDVDGSTRWTVTGRVNTCERIYEEQKRRLDRQPKELGVITLILPSGFCHSRHGPLIDATAAVSQ